uniref:Uncharacterized protein n=1 Tax=Anguilla anguilla TaxID=7936 RepID=A0A0E9RTN3_ANGAN
MLVQVHTTVQLLGGTTDYCITLTLAAVTNYATKMNPRLRVKIQLKEIY